LLPKGGLKWNIIVQKKEKRKEVRRAMFGILLMKKKIGFFITIAAVIMFILSPMSSAAANTSAVVPSDISGDWAQSQIENMFSRGFIGGYPDGTFKPNNPITRAEFITMVNRTFNFTATAPNTFSDVSSSQWFAVEIDKAHAADFISGYGDGTMQPNKPISREEVAVIIAHLKNLQLDAAAADKFNDAAAISNWSKPSVGAVVNANIMDGYPNGTFQPKSPITRSEAIMALSKALGN
jgi:hypothetical protein